MNWLDMALVLFLLLSAFLGLRRGLVGTLVPVLGLLVGVVVAGRYYDALAHRVFSSQSDAAYVIAFVLIVAVFLVAGTLLASMLRRALSLVMLGWLDRLAGAFLGLALGGLSAGPMLALLLRYSVAVSTIENSTVASFLLDKFPIALALLPADFALVKDFFR